MEFDSSEFKLAKEKRRVLRGQITKIFNNILDLPNLPAVQVSAIRTKLTKMEDEISQLNNGIQSAIFSHNNDKC